ncbi:hypothetical protein [Lysobacter tyrosinilyticus]
MIKIIATAAALLLASACSAEVKSHYPTVSLVETDGSGKDVRELRFELTDRPAKTCISGNWKQASVLTDTNGYTKSPAYIMADGKLEVLLVNTMCDAYDSYSGTITDNKFSGEHVAYGLGWSKTLGKVSGAYSTP